MTQATSTKFTGCRRGVPTGFMSPVSPSTSSGPGTRARVPVAPVLAIGGDV